MKMMLEDKGIICKEFNSHLLLEPWIIKKKDNTEYKVFTPFYNAFQKQVIPKPFSRVQSIKVGNSFTSKLICFRITIVADYTVDISYGSNMGSDRRRGI